MACATSKQNTRNTRLLCLSVSDQALRSKNIFSPSVNVITAHISQTRIGNYDLWNLEIKLAIKGSAIQTLSYVDPYIHVSETGSAQHKHMSCGTGREGEWERGWPSAPTLVKLYVCRFTDVQPGRGQLEKCEKSQACSYFASVESPQENSNSS